MKILWQIDNLFFKFESTNFKLIPKNDVYFNLKHLFFNQIMSVTNLGRTTKLDKEVLLESYVNDFFGNPWGSGSRKGVIVS
jgi:hypothetical protein